MTGFPRQLQDCSRACTACGENFAAAPRRRARPRRPSRCHAMARTQKVVCSFLCVDRPRKGTTGNAARRCAPRAGRQPHLSLARAPTPSLRRACALGLSPRAEPRAPGPPLATGPPSGSQTRRARCAAALRLRAAARARRGLHPSFGLGSREAAVGTRPRRGVCARAFRGATHPSHASPRARSMSSASNLQSVGEDVVVSVQNGLAATDGATLSWKARTCRGAACFRAAACARRRSARCGRALDPCPRQDATASVVFERCAAVAAAVVACGTDRCVGLARI